MGKPPELWGENDWIYFLLSLEDEVCESFMALVSLFEVSRNVAECFRPVTIGHVSQYPEPFERGELVVGREHQDVPRETPERILRAAA